MQRKTKNGSKKCAYTFLKNSTKTFDKKLSTILLKNRKKYFGNNKKMQNVQKK